MDLTEDKISKLQKYNFETINIVNNEFYTNSRNIAFEKNKNIHSKNVFTGLSNYLRSINDKNNNLLFNNDNNYNQINLLNDKITNLHLDFKNSQNDQIKPETIFLNLNNKCAKSVKILVTCTMKNAPSYNLIINNEIDDLNIFRITQDESSQKPQIITIINNSNVQFIDLIDGRCNKQIQNFIFNKFKNATSKYDLRSKINYDSNLDVYSKVFHQAPNTNSSMKYKIVIDDYAKATLVGNILINEKCPLVDSSFQSKHLLLSKDAHVVSYPELEIHTDDVKCSHGSSTGSLQTEEIFYLESRGINNLKARNMLMNAFLDEDLLFADDTVERCLKEMIL